MECSTSQKNAKCRGGLSESEEAAENVFGSATVGRDSVVEAAPRKEPFLLSPSVAVEVSEGVHQMLVEYVIKSLTIEGSSYNHASHRL